VVTDERADLLRLLLSQAFAFFFDLPHADRDLGGTQAFDRDGLQNGLTRVSPGLLPSTTELGLRIIIGLPVHARQSGIVCCQQVTVKEGGTLAPQHWDILLDRLQSSTETDDLDGGQMKEGARKSWRDQPVEVRPKQQPRGRDAISRGTGVALGCPPRMLAFMESRNPLGGHATLCFPPAGRAENASAAVSGRLIEPRELPNGDGEDQGKGYDSQTEE
jgi:hypothetical protein